MVDKTQSTYYEYTQTQERTKTRSTFKTYFDVYEMACENKALVLGRALNLCIYDYGISVLNTGRFCARHQNIHMP